MLEQARCVAVAEASLRMDYYVAVASDTIIGDGVRLVPSTGNHVPFKLWQSLVVTHVSQMFGLVAVSLRPRAAVNRDAIGASIGWPSGDEPVVDDFEATVVYTADYPVLIRY